MAIWVTASRLSHSAMLSSSRVMVPQRRFCCCNLPSLSIRRTQASMLSLCTSNPAQQTIITSITFLLRVCLGDIDIRISLPCVLPERSNSFGYDAMSKPDCGAGSCRRHRDSAFAHAVAHTYFHLFWVGLKSHVRLRLKVLVLVLPAANYNSSHKCCGGVVTRAKALFYRGR